MSARAEVLARIRSALGDGPRPPLDVPRAYRTAGTHPPGGPRLVDLLRDRLVDYRAGVRRADPDGLAGAVAAALTAGLQRRPGPAASGQRTRLAIAGGLPDGWVAAVDADLVPEESLDVAGLDACDAVVTASTVAIAETGTIILDGSPTQGRRALTLLPDVHVCVVGTDKIVAGVPDAMARLDPARPLTWISGPSATSDIELDRVEGVHGPRVLEVVLLDGGPMPHGSDESERLHR